MAKAPRNEGEGFLRDALAANAPALTSEEWTVLDAAIEMIGAGPERSSRGGRSARRKAAFRTSRGVSVPFEVVGPKELRVHISGRLPEGDLRSVLSAIRKEQDRYGRGG